MTFDLILNFLFIFKLYSSSGPDFFEAKLAVRWRERKQRSWRLLQPHLQFFFFVQLDRSIDPDFQMQMLVQDRDFRAKCLGILCVLQEDQPWTHLVLILQHQVIDGRKNFVWEIVTVMESVMELSLVIHVVNFQTLKTFAQLIWVIPQIDRLFHET